jgi:hypothetical protein
LEAEFVKNFVTRKVLQDLVLAKAAGEWGCEDMTGVTVERCDPAINGRNWNVTHLQNEDLPAAEHTVLKIVERLGTQYDLKGD